MKVGAGRKIIIPAAGFGTRVGAPEAKELLPRPDNGRPLISRALELSYALNIPAVVITRREKVSLLDYLKKQSSGCAAVEVVIVEPTREWPASILAAKEKWADENVLILPDTDFQPLEIVEGLFKALNDSDVAVAAFSAPFDELSSFGAFAELSGGKIVHAEKPRELPKGSVQVHPWGLLGFRPEAGTALFQQMLESTFDHDWRQVPGRVSFLNLEKFADLTRK